ncbi:Mrr restriction system protein [Aquisphaera giovannonii]|uniref:Mrr restriction system protein n=1 Tax=Aquisphaera giovannonii TaxID=406548 RepID=A0A5B9W214_9BACT|nr:restriction endonuclease [Aquisphaera giovannonii]QEH34020.1 Mrr restriction system protein [Aquisphaera giovannonii]
MEESKSASAAECLGPQCAAMVLDWLRARAGEAAGAGAGAVAVAGPRSEARQGLLWRSAPYSEDSPRIASTAELAGAIEHLQYAVFRRFENTLTRAERIRLDNSIENALFKVDRYLARADEAEVAANAPEVATLRAAIREGREKAERMRTQARRAELKLAQLTTLSPETFEEFVAELFESLGYEVEQTGGSGDEGADLRLRRKDMVAIVQCKYHKRGVVGSPELQKFLGTVHHTRSHKGFFVTTSSFSLAAERFVAEHPIELIDGPRLVELVQHAMGPGARREPLPAWF